MPLTRLFPYHASTYIFFQHELSKKNYGEKKKNYIKLIVFSVCTKVCINIDIYTKEPINCYKTPLEPF